MEEKLLLKYLQHECQEAEIKLISEWLSESEENRQELFRLELVINSNKIDRYSDQAFIQKEKLRLFNRIEKYRTIKRKSLFRKTALYVSTSAAVALLSIGLFLLYQTNQTITVIANQGSVEQMLLPDGTKVWLNGSSKLKYSKSFNDKKRSVQLEGEAYFEVAKDASRPFVVQTDVIDVTVLGTKFNLNATKKSNKSFVTLVEGEVQVRGNDNEGMVTLTPGQRAELDKPSHKLYVKEIQDPAMDALWHNKLIPFDKVTLLQIAATLEQLYGVKVHIDALVDNSTYSGVLKVHDDIEGVLRSLKNSIAIKYKIDKNDVYISGDN